MNIEKDLPHSVIRRSGDDDLGTVDRTEFTGVQYPADPEKPVKTERKPDDQLRERATKKAEKAYGGDDDDVPYWAK